MDFNIMIDHITALKLQKEVVVPREKNRSHHTKALDHFEQVDDVKISVQHLRALVQVKVSRKCPLVSVNI